jgi:RNA polymerase-binding transcription factor DksA
VPVWAPPSPRQRLQAKLLELIEIVGIRQPAKVESLARPLKQASVAGRLEIRTMDLSRHNFNLLQQILKALDRIEAGTYGTCKRCQANIETSLLSATPWAALCSDCEQRPTQRC